MQMKRITKLLAATLVCSFLTTGSQQLLAQDASNPQTARSQDTSDWGLLGLIGLIGLLGLRKKGRED
jgi:hypothetical protein